MGESLYTVLGVDRDADAQAIDRAFRDLAKARHPDTNDDPDARRQFKRLKVARETLADADERARYDRLGHAEYVRQCGFTELFDVETATPTGTASSDEQTATVRTDGYGDPDGDWWADRTTESTHGRSATPTGGGGIYGGQSGAGATGQATPAPGAGLLEAVRTLGPWAALHLVLLVSVSIAGWFLLSGGAAMSVSGPVAVVVGLIVLATLAISALHIALRLYT